MIFALFLNYFFYVGVKVLQQKNVMHDHYARMIPVSYLMAFGDVFGIFAESKAAMAGEPLAWLVVAAGTGGWMGGVLAMWAHNRFQTRAV